MYTVRLENTVTHQIYEQQVEDTNDGGKLYFRFGISTIDLADGEYILTVFGENGDVLAEDLLRIGDFNPQTLQYTKGEKTYLDITVDAILQREKNVSITDIHTRILPDLGNDAVEIVYVDAQPLYDSARSEGYDEGYGVGQSEGYPNGYADGYNKGTEDGYNTGSAEAYPKGYEDGYDSGRTDGYNEGYDVGSMDMHLEMLEETRILNVTENGRYLTKYTEDPYIPTGDGDFSDFCKLTNTTYQMGRLKSYKEAQKTGADVIEFWWRPKDLAYNHRPMILMSSAENDGNGIHHTFSINLLTYDREDKLRFRSDAGGGTFVEHIISSGPEMWYHILIQNSELYINDEFISNFYIVNDNETSYIYLNGDTRNDVEDGIDECNGYFGMVKINGEVFIPTENGYMGQNTGNIIQPIESGEYEYLRQRDPEGGLYRTVNVNIDTKQFFLNGYDEATQKIMGGVQDLTITENGQYGDGETLYRTIDVNVVPKVNVPKAGIKFGYSKITEVPDWADFDGITDFSNMFNDCGNLKRIPVIDTSQVTDMNNTFKNCSNLETIPLLDTSKVTTMDSTFWYCTKLSNFPPIDTSSVTQIVNAFSNCYSLTSLPALNMQSLNMYSFYGIFGYNELPNLINFGGFLNLKHSLTDDRNLKKLPNLTYESCINVLNGLYDFVGNGETPNSEQGQLKVHQNFLDKVGDEISIGTSKGWTITA